MTSGAGDASGDSFKLLLFADMGDGEAGGSGSAASNTPAAAPAPAPSPREQPLSASNASHEASAIPPLSHVGRVGEGVAPAENSADTSGQGYARADRAGQDDAAKDADVHGSGDSFQLLLFEDSVGATKTPAPARDPSPAPAPAPAPASAIHTVTSAAAAQRAVALDASSSSDGLDDILAGLASTKPAPKAAAPPSNASHGTSSADEDDMLAALAALGDGGPTQRQSSPAAAVSKSQPEPAKGGARAGATGGYPKRSHGATAASAALTAPAAPTAVPVVHSSLHHDLDHDDGLDVLELALDDPTTASTTQPSAAVKRPDPVTDTPPQTSGIRNTSGWGAAVRSTGAPSQTSAVAPQPAAETELDEYSFDSDFEV